MPQQAWNAKRERQYEHIKESLEERDARRRRRRSLHARSTRSAPARARRSVVAPLPDDLSSGRRGGLVQAPP